MSFKKWLFFISALMVPLYGYTTLIILFAYGMFTNKDLIWGLLIFELFVCARFTVDGYNKTKSGWFSRKD